MLLVVSRNRKLVLDYCEKLKHKEDFVKTSDFKGILTELFRANRHKVTNDILDKMVNFADRKGWIQPKYMIDIVKSRADKLRAHPT